MASFHFELVSPDKSQFSGAVESVLVPGSEGDFVVLKDHAPVMASLRPGIVAIGEAAGKETRFFVRGSAPRTEGFDEALSGSQEGPDRAFLLPDHLHLADTRNVPDLCAEGEQLDEQTKNALGVTGVFRRNAIVPTLVIYR
jgi:hypothetical protein